MKHKISVSSLPIASKNWLVGLLFVLVVSSAFSATQYWDINGATAASGGPTPNGTWSASGNANWTSDSTGSSATTDWIAGTNATFSAGTDATAAYTVTVNGTVDVGSIVEQSAGAATLNGGVLNFTKDGLTNFYTTITHKLICNSQITGNITNLMVSGGGTSRGLELNNSTNNWAGNLTIGSGVTLNLHDADEVIPDWAVVNLAPGRLRLSTGTAGTGKKETIGGLTGNGGVSMDGGKLILNVTNTSVTYVWNGLGANSAPTGSGSITKRGAGTQVMGGTAGNYGGGTTNLEGMLGAGVDNAFGTGTIFLFGGGIFSANATNQTLSNPVVLDADTTLGSAGKGDLTFTGPWTLTNASRTLTINNTNTTITGVISDPTAVGGGALGITKAGPGTLALAGDNTYAGGTVVSNGTLSIADFGIRGSGTGNVMVASSGTIGGVGLVGGFTTVQGGAISPGTTAVPAYTLKFMNGLTMLADSIYLWGVNTETDDSSASSEFNWDVVQVVGGTLAIHTTAKLGLSFGPGLQPAFSNAFWQAPHTWTIIRVDNPAINPTNATITTITNASFAAGSFSTLLDSGTGNTKLTYTPNVAPPFIQPLVLSGTGTTNVTIAWTTVAAHSYQLQYNTNLNTTNWIVLSNIVAAGSALSVTNFPPAGDPQRYYRVLAQ